MFVLQAFRSRRQAAKAEGNVATQLFNDSGRVFWTGTVWTNEAAMKAFMLSGAHKQVMRKLLDWCDEAAVAHWTQESTEPPTWEEAHARLHREGRLSKVNHPSAAHTAFAFPKPRAR
jgi:heme-degrading monooxygenase HmoA